MALMFKKYPYVKNRLIFHHAKALQSRNIMRNIWIIGIFLHVRR